MGCYNSMAAILTFYHWQRTTENYSLVGLTATVDPFFPTPQVRMILVVRTQLMMDATHTDVTTNTRKLTSK